ncbi:MAG: NAD(P)H-hydrate dehydratase [Sedimentisphaerales bacterium]|jgi:NAD(P)H-hydrate epimerase|nr:NAD(P)H-hydrate dehydratase [Sedimentisphaerales bacterium]HNY79388.1 NAD(P)H-hydrate dehydratase [Sedimentisphaerales bacterium]HOC64577.1 NAD(P)H-hydrate dehydratase [Sedimentisphaerales bacterium]HOH65354.1 NAD(P)H-hydrate dehydratase [Sedimentisphaerales bacterium]HPY50387.1 NAD(P)H-hydrate dehydratase [Sedimentisphaerales bacterium]
MEIVREAPRLKPRPVDGHKGTFGKVCIVAGSVGMSGAAALAGRAALRSGAGLVRVATARSALPVVAAIESCYTTIALAEDAAGRISGKAIGAILEATAQNDVTAIGPGLGASAGLRSVIETLIRQEGLRLLIDGDGLNNLSRLPDWPRRRRAQLVLTPHPGEMARLWSGLFRDEIPSDRQEAAARMAQATDSVVALKGAGTVVADGQRFYVNDTGNPGMATAGSGDVLTGVVAALMGQGLDNFEATALGVHVHGAAGDIAAETYGQISLTATDILEALPEAFATVAPS